MDNKDSRLLKEQTMMIAPHRHSTQSSKPTPFTEGLTKAFYSNHFVAEDDTANASSLLEPLVHTPPPPMIQLDSLYAGNFD